MPSSMPTSATPKKIGVSTLSFGNRPVMTPAEIPATAGLRVDQSAHIQVQQPDEPCRWPAAR
jgi:hypothetical protein